MVEEEKNKNQNTSEEPDGIKGHETKVMLALRAVKQLKSQIENIERLLEQGPEADDGAWMDVLESSQGKMYTEGDAPRCIDGVFDGLHMIGEDGCKYAVPANYASKSKLVEGDLLRLTVGDRGRFIFKQKGPIERLRLVGLLIRDDTRGTWKVASSGQRYHVLPSAVSFFQGDVGDEAVILVPKDTPSRWAAIENIVKKAMSV